MVQGVGYGTLGTMLSLKSDTIKLCIFSLEDNTKDYASYLSLSEKQRADANYFPEKKRRYIVSHGMLRLILGSYLGQEPKTLEFKTNQHGKPYLDADIKFNLSHSRDLAVLALGKNYDLGVDLECFSKREYINLSNKYFAADEREYLNISHPAALALRFFKIWTQKEAYVKALGQGLTFPTTSFSCMLGIVPTETWQMSCFTPYPAVQMALCHNTAVKNIEFVQPFITIG
jgi:4'-phosphopantetheinyl transferase